MVYKHIRGTKLPKYNLKLIAKSQKEITTAKLFASKEKLNKNIIHI